MHRLVTRSAIFILAVALIAPVLPANAEQITIGASLVTQDNQWWANGGKFLQQAAEAAGVKLILTYAQADQEKQLRDVEDLIARRVDGIIIGPVHEQGSKVAVDKAAAAGIPVVVFARRTASSNYVASFVYREQLFGYWQAIYLTSVLASRGGGSVVYLFAPVGAGYPQYQNEGFRSVIDQHPEIKMLGVLKGPTDNIAEGMRLMEDALVRFPKIDAVVANNDDLALGAIRAAQAAGRAKDILFFGSSGIPQGMQAIYDGEMAFTCLKSPAIGIVESFNTLLAYLKGAKPAVKDVLLQPVPVSKENVLDVRDPLFGGTVTSPSAYTPKR